MFEIIKIKENTVELNKKVVFVFLFIIISIIIPLLALLVMENYAIVNTGNYHERTNIFYKINLISLGLGYILSKFV